jgi:hypothetical protein
MSRRQPRLQVPLCPICRKPVECATMFGQKSYSHWEAGVGGHWGKWSMRIWTPAQLATAPQEGVRIL